MSYINCQKLKAESSSLLLYNLNKQLQMMDITGNYAKPRYNIRRGDSFPQFNVAATLNCGHKSQVLVSSFNLHLKPCTGRAHQASHQESGV